MPVFKKRDKEERSVYLMSPMGSLIYVPKRRAEVLVKRVVHDQMGKSLKYRKATDAEIKKGLKEPRTNTDEDLIAPEVE